MNHFEELDEGIFDLSELCVIMQVESKMKLVKYSV
jgi:hypothetical protein